MILRKEKVSTPQYYQQPGKILSRDREAQSTILAVASDRNKIGISNMTMTVMNYWFTALRSPLTAGSRLSFQSARLLATVWFQPSLCISRW